MEREGRNSLVLLPNYICHHCKFNAHSKKQIKWHIKYIHFRKNKEKSMKTRRNMYNECFQCPDCGAPMFNKTDLIHHRNRYHRRLLLSCALCDFKATSKHYLKKHIKANHGNCNNNNNPIKYSCSGCDYQTPYCQNLLQHYETKHLKLRYPCPYCDVRKTDISHLLKHINHIYKGILFFCEHCSFKSPRKNRIREHILVCHDTSMHQCKHCHFKSTYKYLMIHTKLKHFAKSHCCLLCDYTTYYSHTLKRHVSSVHGLKNEIPCKYCKMKFPSRSILKNHILANHREKFKSFRCKKCNFVGLNTKSLREHNLKVHLKIQYQCPICPYQTVRKCNLKRHAQLVHNSSS